MNELEINFLKEIQPLIEQVIKENNETLDINPWTDNRSSAESIKREYSNDYEGELLQRLDEEKGYNERKELIAELKELRKNRIEIKQREIYQRVQDFLVNQKEEYQNKIEQKEQELKEVEEKNKLLTEKRIGIINVRNVINERENPKIYKAAMKEEKEAIKQLKQLSQREEELKNEIDLLKLEWNDIEQKYKDIDVSNIEDILFLNNIIKEIEQEEIEQEEIEQEEIEQEEVEQEEVEQEEVEQEEVEQEEIEQEEIEQEEIQQDEVENAEIEPVKIEPVKVEIVKAIPVKTEPVKTEPVKAQPVKTEPVKTQPTKTEPAKVKAVKAKEAKAQKDKKQERTDNSSQKVKERKTKKQSSIEKDKDFTIIDLNENKSNTTMLNDDVSIFYSAKTDAYMIKNVNTKEQNIVERKHIGKIHKSDLAEKLGKSLVDLQNVDVNVFALLSAYDKANKTSKAIEYFNIMTQKEKSKTDRQKEMQEKKISIKYDLRGLFDKHLVRSEDPNKTELEVTKISKEDRKELLKIADNANVNGIASVKKGIKVRLFGLLGKIKLKPVNLFKKQQEIKRLEQKNKREEQYRRDNEEFERNLEIAEMAEKPEINDLEQAFKEYMKVEISQEQQERIAKEAIISQKRKETMRKMNQDVKRSIENGTGCKIDR